MKVIRSTEHKRMPWKNGGGETLEIAVHPPAVPLDAFDWRLSMARVESDGPFSAFADIDRILVILDGAGMELSVANRASVELTAHSGPYAFPGDSPTSARLLAGAVTDLNVMTRRGKFAAMVRAGREPAQVRLAAEWNFVVCAAGRVAFRDWGPFSGRVFLGPLDVATCGAVPEGLDVDVIPATRYLVIGIDPC